MFLLKPFHITEPADRVADRPHRKLNHHLFSRCIIIMGENRFPASLLMNDQAEFDVKFLDTGHICAGDRIRAVKDDPRINIRERHMILFPVMRKQNPDSVIEIKLDALHCVQRGNLRHFPVDARLFRLLCLDWKRFRWFLCRNACADGNVIGILNRSDTEIIHSTLTSFHRSSLKIISNVLKRLKRLCRCAKNSPFLLLYDQQHQFLYFLV